MNEGKTGGDFDSQKSGGFFIWERYCRQMKITEWNEKAQKKLDCTHVTVVGAGGLGSPVLLYLAAAGIGELYFIDHDTVSLSNLNRQILYNESDIGASKAKAAAGHLTVFNSDIHLACSPETLTADTIDEIIPPTHIIVDCLDNYAARFLLNRYAVKHGIPMVHAGIHGFNGQITTIIPGMTPCLECLYAGLQDEMDENGNRLATPVLGPTAGTIGSLQAMEVIKLATGIGELYRSRLLIFEGLNGRFEEVEIERDQGCKVCGAHNESGV